MPHEIPGGYQEQERKKRESKEKEASLDRQKRQQFEVMKEVYRKKGSLDIHELRRRIQTGQSLESLRHDLALYVTESEGHESLLDAELARAEITPDLESYPSYESDPRALPLGWLALTRYFESKKLGEDVFIDIAGFFYGFAIQGSAMMIYLFYRLILDLLLLPRDLYQEFTDS